MIWERSMKIFFKYLSEVKMLRNCYMYHDEEDTDSEADGEDEEE